MKQVLKGKNHYWVLLCDEWSTFRIKKENPMICGVYPSLKEARAVAKAVKDCPCKHSVKKCTVSVEV